MSLAKKNLNLVTSLSLQLAKRFIQSHVNLMNGTLRRITWMINYRGRKLEQDREMRNILSEGKQLLREVEALRTANDKYLKQSLPKPKGAFGMALRTLAGASVTVAALNASNRIQFYDRASSIASILRRPLNDKESLSPVALKVNGILTLPFSTNIPVQRER